MSIWARCRHIWRQIVAGRSMDRDLEAELQAWVALAADEEAAGRAVGPAEARRRVLAEAGGLEQIKEGVRGSRSTAFVDTLVRDIRIGLRQMLRNPGVTTAAVVAMALGVGATVATVSVVDAVLVRPLAYEDPAALVVVMHERDKPISPANFLDWQRLTRSFSAMAAAEYWTPNIGGDSPEKVFALRVTPELFPLLGIEPAQGRVLSRDQPGAREVVIGSGFWRRRFGGDPAVIGQELRLDGALYQIVGVMPPGFSFAPFWATRAEIWGAMDLTPRAGSRDGNSLRAFARLAPAVSLAQAQSDVEAVTAGLEREFPGTNRDVRVTPLRDMVTGDVRLSILVILAAVILVLLIACANVAHMLLARAPGRAKEVAVRTALGASRRRLVRQFLTESVLMGLAGGAAGVLLAHLSLGVLVALAGGRVPRIDAASVDLRALGVALVVSIGTGLVFGLVPALRANTPNLTGTLRDGERGSTSRRGHGTQRALIISEIALAVVLLVGAGLMIRSFAALRAVDPGFDPDRLLSVVVSVSGSAEAPEGRRTAFYRDALARVAEVPGVARASAINHLPLAGDIWGFPYQVEGRAPAGPRDWPSAAFRAVLPGYFDTVRLALVAGRDFDDRDDLDAPGVIIVNEWMAATEWPGESAVGRRLQVAGTPAGTWVTVVGVAQNAARSDWAAPPAAEFYLPYLQSRMLRSDSEAHAAYLSFVVRAERDPAALVGPVRSAIRSSAPDVTLSEELLMRDVVAQATAGTRFLTALMGAFAAIAVLLAGVGIHGVMSYIVSGRRHEIGIRLALGASPRRVLVSVVGSGLTLAATGIAIGLVVAFGASGLVVGVVFGVPPTDARVFASVAAALFGIATVACVIPAWRASAVDPLREIRQA